MYLGGGCFWCLEAIYQMAEGVTSVVSGYAGGSTDNPDYESVCSGNTGHAEVVEVTYDPDLTSFQILLEIFWHIHDPTQKDRQGNDTGTQYRSVIYTLNEQQKVEASRSMEEAEKSGLWKGSFTTEIEPLKQFYPAEKYHQNYYRLNRMFNPYCMAVIDPKIEKFFKTMPEFIKKEYTS